MLKIRGITVSVGYGDLLAITLPRNMRHMVECVVVTGPEDERTQAVARSVPGVRLVISDTYRMHQASFNKGIMFETAWNAVGRGGSWWLIHDADIILPDELPLDQLRPDTLYGARRRILEDPTRWTPDLDWKTIPYSRDGGPVGFTQIFHADAPALRGKRPWYDVSFAHAGGGDAWFMNLFPNDKRVVLPVDVLHLGPKDTHWWGVSPDAKDKMAAFIVRNGWHRSHPHVDRSACDRVGDLVERVDVPGYEKSDYELPFVQRAKQMRK